MPKNYYETLDVAKDASVEQVKKAYRRLALQYHPDKHRGDREAEKKFKEINEAYEVLSDKQKRANYDQFGSADAGGFGGFGGQGASGSGFGAGQGFSGQGFGAEGFDFSSFAEGGFADIFENFFGAQGGRAQKKKRGPRRGEDIEFEMQITFEEAVFGVEKELAITKTDHCDHCRGTGAEPGSKTIICPSCRGSGEVRSVRQTLFGQIATSQVCPQCYGEGNIQEKKCTVCQGSTRVRKSEKIRVRIPAGVDNDSTIRLSNKGEAGIFGGQHGDLYVHLRVTPSKKFVRSGFDVHTEDHIHLLQAVLGDEISVETLHGEVMLKIPAGTQSGKIFRLKAYGIQKLNSQEKGDHFVKIIVDVPGKLSKKEKELYLQLAKEGKIRAKDNFFSKIIG